MGKELTPVEVTEEMLDAGLEALEPFAYTIPGSDGYDLIRGLPAAYMAMTKKREESHS